ncbi:hypothetical protein QFZ67_007655 [Streptomyces sp. V1I1]|nr:hypothetical protein [Streptomyces sp. V1I1]
MPEPFPRGSTGPVHRARSLSAGVRETVKILSGGAHASAGSALAPINSIHRMRLTGAEYPESH